MTKLFWLVVIALLAGDAFVSEEIFRSLGGWKVSLWEFAVTSTLGVFILLYASFRSRPAKTAQEREYFAIGDRYLEDPKVARRLWQFIGVLLIVPGLLTDLTGLLLLVIAVLG